MSGHVRMPSGAPIAAACAVALMTAPPLLRATTIVPTPARVSSSSSSTWDSRPSIRCTDPTPCSMARMQPAILGIIPPEITPELISCCTRSVPTRVISEAGSSTSASSPGTSVRKMSFSAASSWAISVAASSALML